MDTLVLWSGIPLKPEDHKDRSEKLAQALATTAHHVSLKPKKVPDLRTLVFWGHGEHQKFCELTPDEFVPLVSSWKKLNPGLETVEMLTCNARHSERGAADSYTQKVVNQLTVKHAGIRFRALPVATTKKGDVCNWSILKWHPASATWAYIGAPTHQSTATAKSGLDTTMHSAVRFLEDFMPPKGPHVGYPRAMAAMEAFTGLNTAGPFPTATGKVWTQAQVDTYNKAAKELKESAFFLAGTLGSLRWCLVDIR